MVDKEYELVVFVDLGDLGGVLVVLDEEVELVVDL